MLRAIGRAVLKVAKAIDTANAIKHGVPVRRRGVTVPRAHPAAAIRGWEPAGSSDPLR